MKILPVFIALSLSVFAMPAQAQSPGRTCVVADPSGTPLNVRLAPNGRIVDELANGTWVHIDDVRREHGKAWAYVAESTPSGRIGLPIGWVFRDYLNCR